jgi:PmbA protein
MKKNPKYMEIVVFAVEQAKKLGADEADAFLSDSQTVQINVSNRQTEQVNAVVDAGIGLRIIKDQKLVFGSSNDLDKESVKKLVDDLMKKCPYHSQDEFNTVAGKENGVLKKEWSSYSNLLSFDPKIAEVSIKDKIKRAIKLEAAGLDYSKKIIGSMMALYRDRSIHYYLANSKGISGCFPSSGCGGFLMLSAAEGKDRQSGNYFGSSVTYDAFDPEKVGRTAAENAVKMLGAKAIESCEIPMVVSPDVGTAILGYIVGMLSADRVQKGKSLFAGKIGTTVASDIFNLIDDGKLKGGMDTAPVDGEGVPRQTTPLIINGKLKNFLYDCYAAKKGKTKSTGNCSRGGYQSQGRIDCTNLYIKPGKTSRKNIVSDLKKGFYLKDAIGLHAGIDFTSGDFSIPVAGFMIDQGKISHPVRGISIGGNLFDFLKSVDKIGDDLTWAQSIGCPTFSVSSIKIGGVGKKG